MRHFLLDILPISSILVSSSKLFVSGMVHWYLNTLIIVANLATECDPKTCNSKKCRCAMKTTPGNLAAKDTPKFVLFTMDDAMSRAKYQFVSSILDKRLNPNGCPIQATFFVSATHDLGDVKRLNEKGREIEK